MKLKNKNRIVVCLTLIASVGCGQDKKPAPEDSNPVVKTPTISTTQPTETKTPSPSTTEPLKTETKDLVTSLTDPMPEPAPTQKMPNLHTAVGPCSVTGTIQSFRIDCEKEIKAFSVGFITSGKGITNMATINGVKYNMNIENTGTSLVGYEKAAKTLDIIINLADNSTAAVTLRAE